jgi:hypothetical protein
MTDPNKDAELYAFAVLELYDRLAARLGVHPAPAEPSVNGSAEALALWRASHGG